MEHTFFLFLNCRMTFNGVYWHKPSRALLSGLENLLTFYVPALFIIGLGVRDLTWDGGLTGSVKGDKARVVLLQSLSLMVHLLQDWGCRSEYTKTLSVALLQWQPWMDTLPGCCFVEESCEALLSRMVGRMRANANVVDFENVCRLYVTLPRPSSDPRGTTGVVRTPLLLLLRRRLRRILTNPASQPFPKVTSARDATWSTWSAPATGFAFPRVPDPDTSGDMSAVLRRALFTLTANVSIQEAVTQFARQTWAPRPPGRHSPHTTVSSLRQQLGIRAPRIPRPQPTAHADHGRADAPPELLMEDAVQPAAQFVDTDELWEPEDSVPPTAPSSLHYPPPTARASDGATLYQPPTSSTGMACDEDAFSEGYHSYGDDDSLGSAGYLLEPGHAVQDDRADDLMDEEDGSASP